MDLHLSLHALDVLAAHVEPEIGSDCHCCALDEELPLMVICSQHTEWPATMAAMQPMLSFNTRAKAPLSSSLTIHTLFCHPRILSQRHLE